MTAPIVVSREFRHGASELFAAWGAAAALLEWFGESGSRVVALTQDFRPGGAYRVETLDPEGVTSRSAPRGAWSPPGTGPAAPNGRARKRP